MTVLPITHAPPQLPKDGMELPQPTKARLGLDGERSWVMVSEANSFTWPGPDFRFVPGQGPESAAYGVLPPLVSHAIRDRVLAQHRDRKASLAPRSV